MKRYVFDSAVLYGTIAGGFVTDDITALVAKFTEANRLGCNDEGVSFTMNQELHSISEAGDNERGVIGRERMISCTGTIEGSINVFDKTLFEMCSLVKDTENTDTKYDVYIPNSSIIDESAYRDIALVGTTTTGQDMIIVCHNCLNEEGFSMDTKAKDEAVCKVKFTGRIKQEDKAFGVNAKPVEIIIPKETVQA